MDNVTIPPEVVEELRHCVRRVTGVEIAPMMAEDIAAAMLAAWPEAWIAASLDNGRDCLALPIQQEKPSHE